MRPSRDRAVEWLRVYLAAARSSAGGDPRCRRWGISSPLSRPHRLGVRLQRVPGVGARHMWLIRGDGPGSPRGRGGINQSGDVGGVCPLTRQGVAPVLSRSEGIPDDFTRWRCVAAQGNLCYRRTPSA